MRKEKKVTLFVGRNDKEANGPSIHQQQDILHGEPVLSEMSQDNTTETKQNTLISIEKKQNDDYDWSFLQNVYSF